MLTVFATITAKPGKEALVEEVLRSYVAPTREEEGCIDYVLHRSLESPHVFMFYENWRSAEDLNRHLESDHIRLGRQRLEGALSEPPHIEKFAKLQ
jgi:quinol monooxygenase YgiN